MQYLKITKGKTIWIISHRFSTVKNTDTILILDNETIIEKGPHEDLIKKKVNIQKFFYFKQKDITNKYSENNNFRISCKQRHPSLH